MKNFILCAFLCFAYVTPAFAVPVKPLGYETHGGDAICAEFLAIFDGIITQMDGSALSPVEKAIVDALVDKRKIVQLSSLPELSLDGVPKDAINYSGEGIAKIEISQKSWARLTLEQKRMLTLHEMLPVAGFNDKDYSISLALYKNAYSFREPDIAMLDPFYNCDTIQLKKLTAADFQNLSYLNLPAIGLGFLCVPAYKVMADAKLDFNVCNALGETALASATTVFNAATANYRKGSPYGSKEKIDKSAEIIKIISASGGTLTCSGYYPAKTK